MRRRGTIFVPIAAFTATLVLTIVLLSSGTLPSDGKTNYWLSLNTSGFGQHVSTSINTGTLNGSDFPPNDLNGLFNSFINLTAGDVAQQIQDVQDEVAATLARVLGIRDGYGLHLSKICEVGDEPSCADYEDSKQGLRSISGAIPAYFVLTNGSAVLVPLVTTMKSTIDNAVSLAAGAAHGMLVLLIIGTSSSGIALAGSAVVLAMGLSTAVVWVNVVFGVLGAVSLLLFAASATGATIGGLAAFVGMGRPFKLQAHIGIPFMAISWVAVLCAMVGGCYWFSLWFVGFRKTAVDDDAGASKERAEREKGRKSWKRISQVVGRTLRIDKAKVRDPHVSYLEV